MPCVERLARLLLGLVLVAELLEQQVRARAGKCVGRELGLDGGLQMAVPGIEAAQEVEHLTGLRDGEADVAKPVGKGLEAGTVVVDAHLALLEGAKFGLQVHSSLHLIVSEEAFNGTPHGECRGVGLVDVVEDTLGDGSVEPVDDGMVVHLPIGIALLERWWREDMRSEAEFAEDRLKEAPPLRVVGLFEIENDRNVVPNVELLNDIGGSRGDDDRRNAIGGSRGVRGMSRGMSHVGGEGGGCERIVQVRSIGH
jgi:hypothetical protein